MATSSVANKKRKNDHDPEIFGSNGGYNPEYWHPTGLAKSEWYPCRTTPNLRPAGGQPFPLRKGKQYRMEDFKEGDNPNDTTPAPACPPVPKKRKICPRREPVIIDIINNKISDSEHVEISSSQLGNFAGSPIYIYITSR